MRKFCCIIMGSACLFASFWVPAYIGGVVLDDGWMLRDWYWFSVIITQAILFLVLGFSSLWFFGIMTPDDKDLDR